MSQNDLIELQGLEKEMAGASPAFFARHYLGLLTPPHQRRWYEYLGNNRHLHLAPREHGKSILFTRAGPLWHLLHIPNYRILLISSTFGLSKAFLDVIESDLTRNEKIKADYAQEVSSFDRKGNQIWVNRDDYGIKEPSITAIGRGVSVTSGHYDYILMDDIIDDDSVRSKDVRDFLITWHGGTIGGLLAPGGKEHIIGTRKHPDDFYNYIKNLGTYTYTEEKAIIKYPDEFDYVYEDHEGYKQAVDVNIKGDYEILWEDKNCEHAWTIEKLLLRKMEMKIIFEREFQNHAVVSERPILNPAWRKNYTTDPSRATGEVVLKPPGFLTSYQGWDNAISLKTEADYTVCCTLQVAKDHPGRCYASFFRGHWDFPTVLALMEKKFKQTRPMPTVVGIESNAFQKAFSQVLKQKTIMPITEVVQTKDKITRISALGSYFESGAIYVDIEDKAFESEYDEFPTGQHDDMLDALEIAMYCLLQKRKRSMYVPS